MSDAVHRKKWRGAGIEPARSSAAEAADSLCPVTLSRSARSRGQVEITKGFPRHKEKCDEQATTSPGFSLAKVTGTNRLGARPSIPPLREKSQALFAFFLTASARSDFFAAMTMNRIRFWVVLGAASLVVVIAGSLWGCPTYHVWQQGLAGEAELKRAEQNRQIKVQEAQAHKEAAQHLADAEIIRAGGVAKANAIIGDSLRGNEAYLRYLWIHNLESGHNAVIYVPTEAGLPILEAGRRPTAVRP